LLLLLHRSKWNPNCTADSSLANIMHLKPICANLIFHDLTPSPHFSHPLRSGGMNVTPALPQAAAAL
jgi:hypothetical protein